MAKKPKSINRLQARELQNKVIPAIKVLSSGMFRTNPNTPEKNFFGYRVNAGELTDNHGETWQLQIHAYRTKKDWINTNELKPIVRKWAIGFRLRVILSEIIKDLFKNG